MPSEIRLPQKLGEHVSAKQVESLLVMVKEAVLNLELGHTLLVRCWSDGMVSCFYKDTPDDTRIASVSQEFEQRMFELSKNNARAAKTGGPFRCTMCGQELTSR